MNKEHCQGIKYATEQEAQTSKMLKLSDKDFNVTMIHIIQCLIEKVNVSEQTGISTRDKENT